MPDKHALLSASSAHRWLECTPSALLEAKKADIETDASKEGTLAHALCEYKLLKRFFSDDAVKPENVDSEMERHSDDYLDFIESLYSQTKDPLLLIEERVDFSNIVPDGFGTADCVIIAEPTMYIVDFKYGQGVVVEAKNNPQMRLYALGALNAYKDLYDIEEVVMTIFQPRREQISQECLQVSELETWAETIVKPKAKLASKGQGEFKVGTWCQFCKLRFTCRARAEEAMKLACYEFKQAAELTDSEIAEVLKQAPLLVKWAKDIESFALTQMLDGKAKYDGFKVVAGRSVRKYKDIEAVEATLKAHGYDDIYQTKLLGLTDLEKRIGKVTFNKLLAHLIEKPLGAPQLVTSDDKREELHLINDFERI